MWSLRKFITKDVNRLCASFFTRPHSTTNILGQSSTIGAQIKLMIAHEHYKKYFSLFKIPEVSTAFRISYTAHRKLKNTGPVIRVNDSLSINKIERIFRELNPTLLASMDIIKKSLQEENIVLEGFEAIFIHNSDTGLVKIVTTDNVRHTVCVQI